jgi:hypothetical protein
MAVSVASGTPMGMDAISTFMGLAPGVIVVANVEMVTPTSKPAKNITRFIVSPLVSGLLAPKTAQYGRLKSRKNEALKTP